MVATDTIFELQGSYGVEASLLPALQAPSAGIQPWWLFWLLVILGLLAVLIWWLSNQTEEGEAAPAAATTQAVPAEVDVKSIPAQAPLPAAGIAVRTPASAVSTPAPVGAAETFPGVGAPLEPAEPLPPPMRMPDDLVLLEGIGPKIANVLKAADITTFNQLAATDPDLLKTILRTANLRLADPDTWPEQARLAAAGDWEGLRVLQSKLRAGRRVE